MKNRLLIGLMIAASFFLTACDKSQEPAEPGATAEEKTAIQSAVDAAKDAGGKFVEKTGEAVEVVKEQSKVFSEKAGEMTESAMAKGKELTAAAMERTKELIAQAKEQVAEGKVDLAEGTVRQLQKIKPSLPESLQDEVSALEEMLVGSAPEEAGAAVAADAQEAGEATEGVSAETEAKMDPPKE